LFTSVALAAATEDNFSSVAGLMVSKYFLLEGFSNLPLMNKLYCSLILAADLLSSAGAKFLAESNFSLIVLFLVVFAIVLFFTSH
jgi:hypothetical protein